MRARNLGGGEENAGETRQRDVVSRGRKKDELEAASLGSSEAPEGRGG